MNLPATNQITQQLLERVDRLDARSQDFVRQMQMRADKFGDEAFYSPKQIKYLTALYRQHVVADPTERPKSNLEKLREKRDKLLRRSRGERARQKRIHLEAIIVVGVGDPVLNHVLNEGHTRRVIRTRENQRQRRRDSIVHNSLTEE